MSDDDRIDTLLRQWGAQQRHLAEQPLASGDHNAVPVPAQRQRVALFAGAAAAAVLLIAGGALAIRDSTGTPSDEMAAAPTTPVTAAHSTVLDVDSHGCATSAAYEPLTATPPPAQPAAHHTLVPGDPESIVVCGYAGAELGGSSEVPAAELSADLAMLRSLPSGYSIDPLERGDSENCIDANDPATSLDSGGDQTWYAVLVHYRGAPKLVLHARVARCGYLGITNGSVSAQRSVQLVEFVAHLGQIDALYRLHVVPATQ